MLAGTDATANGRGRVGEDDIVSVTEDPLGRDGGGTPAGPVFAGPTVGHLCEGLSVVLVAVLPQELTSDWNVSRAARCESAELARL